MAKRKRWIPWVIGGTVLVLGLGYAVFAQTGIPHYSSAAPAIYAKAKALGVSNVERTTQDIVGKAFRGEQTGEH